ncbi:hypothetical protein AB0B25_16300 [Nocardia sp. NPDC049190]|uniref:hypothetical protein n=1 Tax=Nocardia sp. NPDC049190 TaxID=3155650 RepID=UPI0033F1827C
MNNCAPFDAAQQSWDGPWYRVRTDIGASFLPSAGEDLDAVCNVDVEVRLPDGSRWSATVFTIAEVERLMGSWSRRAVRPWVAATSGTPTV